MTDKNLLNKHLTWFENNCGILKREIKSSALATYLKDDYNEFTFIDENDRVLVCLTDTKFGVYRTRWFSKPRMAINIQSITEIVCDDENHTIKIAAPDFNLVRVHFQRKSEYKTFSKSLLEARESVIGTAKQKYQQLLNNLHFAPNEKIKQLSEVNRAEAFHPSVRFWKLVFLIESGEREMVIDLLINKEEDWIKFAMVYPVRFADMISNVRFAQAELLQLITKYGIKRNSNELWKLTLGAVLLLRQGDWAEGAQVANVAQERLNKSASQSELLKKEVQQWPGLIHRLTEAFSSELEKHHIDLEWVTPMDNSSIAGSSSFNVGDTIAVQQIEDNWLDSIYNYCTTMLPLNQCESAWRLLRDGEVEAARQVLRQSTSGYWKQVRGIAPRSDPHYFLAAMLTCEIYLYEGDHEQAKLVIDEACKDCLVFSSVSDHPVLKHAFTLSRFYKALAESNRGKASLYAAQLPRTLDWTSILSEALPAQTVVPERQTGSSEDQLHHFLEWVESAIRSSGSKVLNQLEAEVVELEEALDEDTLKVIVGGETSAGKSTFVNRLLKQDVLVSDRQEATAVPTHIAYATCWSVCVEFNDGSDAIVSKFSDDAACLSEIRKIVRRYGYLGSESSMTVERIQILGPMSILQSGIELIDSPGLNAHALRTERANEVLEKSHVCLFVIDARNALKGGEMDVIEVNQEILSRTIFVLNKADLVSSENEFDVGGNPLEEVVEYVRDQLLSKGNLRREPEVYCVSSIDVQDYESEFGKIRVRLNESILDGKQELLFYRAKRLAREVASLSIRSALEEIHSCEIQLADAQRKVPSDPTVIESYLAPRVKSLWESQKMNYQTRVQQSLSTSMKQARSRIETGIEQKDDLDSITKYIKSSLSSSISSAADRVSTVRNEQWENLTRILFEDITSYFRELYADINFEYEVDMDELLKSAIPMPLPSCNGLFSDIDEKVSSIGGQATGGAAAGAAFGALFGGPVGALIGAGLGGILVGASATDEVKQEIVKLVNDKVDSYQSAIQSAIDLDLKANGTPKIMMELLKCVNREAKRFATIVQQRINEIQTELRNIESQTDNLESIAAEAEAWRRGLSC